MIFCLQTRIGQVTFQKIIFVALLCSMSRINCLGLTIDITSQKMSSSVDYSLWIIAANPSSLLQVSNPICHIVPILSLLYPVGRGGVVRSSWWANLLLSGWGWRALAPFYRGSQLSWVSTSPHVLKSPRRVHMSNS
jgi:hypothetical protein